MNPVTTAPETVSTSGSRTLVLNAGYEPLSVVSFRRALLLVMNGRAIMVEGDPSLGNPYGVIMVNPTRHSHVKRSFTMTFIDWLTSTAGKAAIASFRLEGKQVYFPAP